MKPFLAALAVVALCAFPGWITRGHAAEAEDTNEDSTEAQPKFLQGALNCAFEDGGSTEIHVLLCRFDVSETCVLTAPMPFRDALQGFAEVKILGISSTAEGCSKITFSGSMKSPE
ncbi:hypothetical protein [Taklimakanibacter lacteus]|uniref:hypothetical protein n=1 Tax=Taklimakanibacter lacteus TaxID=2268456 RepID=UPI000E669DD0